MKISPNEVLSVHYYGIVVFFISSIFFGFLIDNIGLNKLLIFSAAAGIIMSLPIFSMIALGKLKYSIIAHICLGLLAGSYCSAQLAFITKLFPVRVRCFFVSIGHSTGIALLGGTFPIVVMNLINKFNNTLIAGWYLTLCSVIGFIFVLLGIYYQKGKPTVT